LDAEDVVVNREHVESCKGCSRTEGNLGVINTREVAGTGRLMLLGLKRERVRIDTGHRGTSVVLESLDLVEVLASLLLETVLAVENELGGGEGTSGLLVEALRGRSGTVTREKLGAVTGVEVEKSIGTGLASGAAGGGDDGIYVSGEVPHSAVRSVGLTDTPHELLDGVVVREADLLLGSGGEGIRTSVLNLLNEVLVTFLGKTPTLLSVEVDVVGPYLESGTVSVLSEFGR